MTPQELEEIKATIRETVIKELRHQRRVSERPEGLMTQAQACSYLNVSPKKLCKLRIDGSIKAQILGRRWRYSKECLDKALQKGSIEI